MKMQIFWIGRTDGVGGADVVRRFATPPPAKEIGVNLALRDLAVKPGDDFEEYANGAWRKTTEIPADRSSTGVDFEVFQKAEKRNADLIREAGAGKPAAGTPQRMIADYYAAYMDTAGIEKRGLAPLKERLAKIAGIKSKTDLARALGQQLRADVDPLNATNFWTENLFGLFVTQALSDPSRTVPYLLAGRARHARPRVLPLRQAGDGETPRRLSNLCRRSAETCRHQRAHRASGTDRALLKPRSPTAHLDRTTSEDVHKANNPWSVAQLSSDAPGLDWNAYLSAAGLDKQNDVHHLAAGRDQRSVRAGRQRAARDLEGLDDLPHAQPERRVSSQGV